MKRDCHDSDPLKGTEPDYTVVENRQFHKDLLEPAPQGMGAPKAVRCYKKRLINVT